MFMQCEILTMMVLGDGQVKVEKDWVDQKNNLKDICDDEADKSA